jgi:uncharacterized membrane protein YfcA
MEWIVLGLVGAAAGLLAGLTGLAGGVVVVPALTWLYGTEALQGAIVVSWFCVFSNSLSATVRHWQDRSPPQRRALLQSTRWYLAGAALVSAAAAFFAAGYHGMVTAPVVGLLQLGLVVAILWAPHERERRAWQQPAGDIGLGAMVGGLSTLTGTGGGCYTVAYLVCAAGLHLRDAVAAATLTGTVVGGLSVLGYLASVALWPHTAVDFSMGSIDASGMAVLVVAGVLAAPLGVAASRLVSTPLLRQLMAGALGFSAVRLLVS